MRKCFKAWLDGRGTIGDLEVLKGIEQIKAFFNAHGASRFAYMKPVTGSLESYNIDENEKIPHRAGFKRKDEHGEWEFFVYPHVMTGELLKGLGHANLLPYLIQEGYLIPDKNGRACKNQRLPAPESQSKKMYHFSSKIAGDEEG